MQNLLQNKRTILFFGVLALLALVLLTATLRNINFLPSQSFGGGDGKAEIQGEIGVNRLLQTTVEVPLWKQATFWFVLFLFVVLVSSLLSPELRKKLLRAFLRLALFALIISYIVQKRPDLLINLFGKFGSMGQLPGPLNPGDAPVPEFQPPQDVNWISFVVGFVAIILFVVVTWWISQVVSKINSSNSLKTGTGVEEIEAIEHIARESLHSLKTGQNYKNAIIECYERMSVVISDKRGLQRVRSMTSSEFASRLISVGLPREPVERLTHLFEVARYGNLPAGQTEINEAIACLSAITESFNEAVG